MSQQKLFLYRKNVIPHGVLYFIVESATQTVLKTILNPKCKESI
jgi:hypothetical protein